jgi:hypothetical protein
MRCELRSSHCKGKIGVDSAREQGDEKDLWLHSFEIKEWGNCLMRCTTLFSPGIVQVMKSRRM